MDGNIKDTIHDSTKFNIKNIQCANCGDTGHIVKDCKKPITSFGIIAFKIVKN